jgi:hypothetical protein
MRSYQVIKDFNPGEQNPRNVSVSPQCVVAVYRHKWAVTFSRKDGKEASSYLPRAAELRTTKIVVDGQEQEIYPLIIVDDLAQVSVSHAKGNHVGNASVQLRPSMNYVNEVLPGDYVFVWMLQDKQLAANVVKRLREGSPCNQFRDGLKFFGKANAVRKRTVQSPQGVRTTMYTLTASSFTELDASVYYEPYLAVKQAGLATGLLQQYGIKLNEIIAKNGLGISTNKIIPVLLEVFYGPGIPTNRGFQGGPDITEGLDNFNQFVVPQPVASVFGIQEGGKPHGQVSFADLLQTVHGVQKYSGDISNDTEPDDPAQKPLGGQAPLVFKPDIAEEERGNVFYTGIEQQGVFLPQVPQFNGQKTVWSIVSQFLNPTINELYATLRIGPNGDIRPTVICRQLPFSSGLVGEGLVMKNAGQDQPVYDSSSLGSWSTGRDEYVTQPGFRRVPLTRMLELPRWYVHPVLIRSVDVGRSDALRFNFIHVQGEDGQKSTNKTGAFVRDPPVRDELDICRSGLRPYMQTVHCSPVDVVNRGAGVWQYILSDILMGQHLTLTGTVETYGIPQPICPGDNLEHDGVVFHIESVNHSFQMAANGTKTFSTSLALSHGVSSGSTTGDDFSIYAGVRVEDLTSYDPAVQTDSVNPVNVPSSNESIVPTLTDLDRLTADDYSRGAQKQDAPTAREIDTGRFGGDI